MTTLRACLQEIIEQGPEFFIRSYTIPGAYRISEWESTTFLAEIEHESPGFLGDPAWLEWRTRSGEGLTGSIHYGTRGFSISNREVPAYGHLPVLKSSQRYQPLNLTRVDRGLLASLPPPRRPLKSEGPKNTIGPISVAQYCNSFPNHSESL